MENSLCSEGLIHRDQVDKEIRNAVKELERSGRGRECRELLLSFLDSPMCSIDQDHWKSIETLIGLYRAGYRGTVLEELREACAK